MTTVSHPADNSETRHGIALTAGLEMASNSVNRWYELDPSGRRELLAVWAEFCNSLRALGVAAPTDPKGL